jgi:hypothetical protein
MSSSIPQNNTLLIPKIQASISDPDNPDALITVELLLSATNTPAEPEPVIMFEFFQRTNNETRIYDSQDIYLSLSDFQRLCSASCHLLTALISETKDDPVVDTNETLRLARYSIEQLSNLVSLLEGQHETYE